MSLIRLYADSASPAAVNPLLEAGLVHGVTTNPTILDRAGRTVANIAGLASTWLDLGAREVFFQAWGDDRATLERCAREILAIDERVIVKVPATRDGFAVTARLAREGLPVLTTAVYSEAQTVLAVSSGARFIAPYLGRMRDSGAGSVDTIAAMQRLCEGTSTTVLAASIRTPDDVVSLAHAGVSSMTMNPDLVWKLIDNDHTERAAREFAASPALTP